LVVENLAKSYQDGDGRLNILKGANLSLRAGESVAVVGKSGSGKSTFLNLVGLLDRPDSGEIWVGGVPASQLSERWRTAFRGVEIGFVFQNYHLLADFTVLENVMLGAAVGRGGGFGRANQAAAMEWLERVGLADRARRNPARLSGGEQQRAAIARALAARPRLLLCDEPTGNLDAATGEEVSGWLWRVARESGMALLVVTHEPALAARADRTVILSDGVLAAA
jgi:ABC-type lipoprotein export system ATPase subunit